ncbi:Tetratricopeptide repeat protein 4 [Plecturocebus cupreus]
MGPVRSSTASSSGALCGQYPGMYCQRESCCVAQAGLELLVLSNPLTSASLSAGISGVSHFPRCNFRSALNDVTTARKLKPCHLKAIIRSALCHPELKHFAEAVNWYDEVLQIDATEKKLLEMKAKADKLKRHARKANLKEKKERNQNEALLQAIKSRNVRLSEAACEDEDSVSEDLGELFLDGLSSENPHGARLSLDDQSRLSWPVLFLYPEYAQSDFISAFHEDSRFIDHLMVMFGETPSWDLEQKYCPDNLEVYFEDEDRAELYQVLAQSTLLQVLQQHKGVASWR